MEDSLFTSRKFILTVFILLTNTFLLWKHVIVATEYNTLMISVLGLYFTGNVVEKIGLVPKA